LHKETIARKLGVIGGVRHAPAKQGGSPVSDSGFSSKRLTFLLEIVAKEAIEGNDGIFLREVGYTIREIRVLRIIDDNPGITFVEIWERSGLERSLTSRILQKLLGDGMLLRSSSGSDARKYHLTTTEKGKAVRLRSRAISDALEEILLEPFGSDDRARMFALVERLGNWVRSDNYRRQLDGFDAARAAPDT
jgi:DNA-binding MarR family transcriptional regulator